MCRTQKITACCEQVYVIALNLSSSVVLVLLLLVVERAIRQQERASGVAGGTRVRRQSETVAVSVPPILAMPTNDELDSHHIERVRATVSDRLDRLAPLLQQQHQDETATVVSQVGRFVLVRTRTCDTALATTFEAEHEGSTMQGTATERPTEPPAATGVSNPKDADRAGHERDTANGAASGGMNGTAKRTALAARQPSLSTGSMLLEANDELETTYHSGELISLESKGMNAYLRFFLVGAFQAIRITYSAFTPFISLRFTQYSTDELVSSVRSGSLAALSVLLCVQPVECIIHIITPKRYSTSKHWNCRRPKICKLHQH